MSDATLQEPARRLYAKAPFLMRHLQALRRLVAPFDELIDAVPVGARVLDVGCGGGLFLALLALKHRITSGTGFDASAPAIHAASAMKATHPSGNLLDFKRLEVGAPWPEGPFDVVSLIDVMHHMPEKQRPGVVHHVAKCLKPGGILLYKDMASRPLFYKAINTLHDLILARQWITHVPFAEMCAWAEDAELLLEEGPVFKRCFWYMHETAVFRKSVG